MIKLLVILFLIKLFARKDIFKSYLVKKETFKLFTTGEI